MNKNFQKIDPIEICGTSFHNGCIKATAKDLTKVLGRCELYNDDKTVRQWNRKISNILFTVYDIDKKPRPKATDIIEYHIGTHSLEDTEIIIKILCAYGLNAYIK
ncbi:hypothetical protein IKN40_05410 [bacterium]|nr:hypothetical protein [bacterium]